MFHGTKARFDCFEVGEDGTCFTSLRRAVGRYAGRVGRVVGAFLAVKNPYVTDIEGWEGEAFSPASVKEDGLHDGYIVKDWAGPGHDMVIVFDSAQICQASGGLTRAA